MTSTRQFALPLLASAQAQKHVTVNDALSRLDAVAQMRVVSSSLTAPPVAPVDGEAYLVPTGGVSDWSGQDGRVAVRVNEGWVYLDPRRGWRLWDEAASDWHMFDGSEWIAGALALGSGGSATIQRIVTVDHDLGAGSTSTVAGVIPAFAQVVGVTGRVTVAITGSAATWRLGVPGFDDRYGSGLGTGVNSSLLGLSGTPVTYYGSTDLLLTAEGGSFAAGRVRLAIHLTELRTPASV